MPSFEVKTRIQLGSATHRIGVIGEGHRQARVTLNERRSMSTLIAHVKKCSVETVAEVVVRRLSPFKHRVQTITSDHGKEFASRCRIARKLKADFDCAHPYASRERGQNENIEGRTRPCCPKGMNISTITEQQLRRVISKLNHRPRRWA